MSHCRSWIIRNHNTPNSIPTTTVRYQQITTDILCHCFVFNRWKFSMLLPIQSKWTQNDQLIDVEFRMFLCRPSPVARECNSTNISLWNKCENKIIIIQCIFLCQHSLFESHTRFHGTQVAHNFAGAIWLLQFHKTITSQSMNKSYARYV